MYDVIYFGFDAAEEYERIGDLIRKDFPNATVEDASDEVHGYRLSISDDDSAREGVWRLLIKEGYPQTLGIQLACRTTDPNYELLKRLVDEAAD